jgi:hypothetical protein
MHSIAAHDPTHQEELAALMRQVPWRYERFGDQILATLYQT